MKSAGILRSFFYLPFIYYEKTMEQEQVPDSPA